MKQILLYTLLLGTIVSGRAQSFNYDFHEYWSTDQILTGAATLSLGSVVRTTVEDLTGSKALGVVSSAITGAAIGYAKDKWDHRNTGPNYVPKWNDTAVGAMGGAVGGFTLRFDIFTGGRATHKSGFGNRKRVAKFKRRKY